LADVGLQLVLKSVSIPESSGRSCRERSAVRTRFIGLLIAAFRPVGVHNFRATRLGWVLGTACGKLQLQLLLWVQLAGLAPYFFLECRASGRPPHGHVSSLHTPGMCIAVLS